MSDSIVSVKVAVRVRPLLQRYILLTKTTAARNGVALSYRSVRGLYFLAVVFVTTIIVSQPFFSNTIISQFLF